MKLVLGSSRRMRLDQCTKLQIEGFEDELVDISTRLSSPDGVDGDEKDEPHPEEQEDLLVQPTNEAWVFEMKFPIEGRANMLTARTHWRE